ncbi:replicative helicase loader/inhibitor [Ectobacillus antri]|uniref:replicative helicase loader/inhibitor n=1 Tax=Ectobacillus antri TaxID=2486280 RepID=UPI000F59833B|nr:replicative helicase loader/inhibitor [Ectobacillus antri]
MNAQQVMSILKYIGAAYPNFEVTEDSMDVWMEMLQDSSFEGSLSRVKEHIRQHRFPPSIAEVIVKEGRNNEVFDKFRKWKEEAHREREHGSSH